MNADSPAVAFPTEKHVTLLMAGLFSIDGKEDASRPASARLHRLLARADRVPHAATGIEARLFGLFGVTPEHDRDLPVAAVTRVIDLDARDSEWWLRADPVYLEAHRDRLVLRAGETLDRSEAEQLVAELGAFLAQDGCQLLAPHPQRWYLKPPTQADIATTAISDAIGRDIYPLLPRGPDQRRWRTRLSELQTLLHRSAVNATREAQGRLPVNSLWFWGSGRLPQLGPVNWSTVWADDPLTLGLARSAGHPSRPLPPEAEQVLAAAGPGNELVVLGNPAERTNATLHRIDDWLDPLIEAVHRGALGSLTLLTDVGPGFCYRRRHRLRVWRHTRPLSAWHGAA